LFKWHCAFKCLELVTSYNNSRLKEILYVHPSCPSSPLIKLVWSCYHYFQTCKVLEVSDCMISKFRLLGLVSYLSQDVRSPAHRKVGSSIPTGSNLLHFWEMVTILSLAPNLENSTQVETVVWLVFINSNNTFMWKAHDSFDQHLWIVPSKILQRFHTL